MVYDRFSGFVEPFELEGQLTPPEACTQINHSYPATNFPTKIRVVGDKAIISFDRVPNELLAYKIRSAVLNVTAALDGQMLLTGQPVQATFNHHVLRPGEGEAFLTGRPRSVTEVSRDQFSVGIRIGQMAEEFPPLGHALRDFRLATIFPHEEGVGFLWRSIETVLWALSDDSVKPRLLSKEINVKAIAAKLGVKPDLFDLVRNAANDNEQHARHATWRYRNRLSWLKKVFKTDTPPLITESIAIGDDNPVDVFPASYDETQWQQMCDATRQILMKFIPCLNPHVQGALIPFMYWK